MVTQCLLNLVHSSGVLPTNFWPLHQIYVSIHIHNINAQTYAESTDHIEICHARVGHVMCILRPFHKLDWNRLPLA